MSTRAALRTAKPNGTKPRWKKWLKRVCWTVALVVFVSALGFSAWIYSVMESKKPLVAHLPQIQTDLSREPTMIYSADGVLLYRMSTEHREPVGWPEIPKTVFDATIAAEDRRFMDHRGVDFTAVLRALWVNITSGSVRQGGSTITQQVAKRLLTSGERTFTRKVEDACLAVLIERELTKEQIFTLYVNQIYYGAGAYGIKAAASVYFNKPLSDLTVAEAALLARIPRRPSDENPFVNPEAAKKNRDIVLEIMREESMISESEYRKALAEPVKVVKRQETHVGILAAPYFVTYILDQLRKEFPSEDFTRGGYKIYTTLNSKAQKHAEEGLKRALQRNKGRRVTEGAVLVMTTSGEILAMVGGSDFKRSQYNAITQGRRQPGSAFKPFVYAAGIEMGFFKPNSMVSNAPFVYNGWRPKGGGKGGYVSIQTAIVSSINVPAVHAGWTVGPDNVARFAKETFGFRSFLDPVPSLPLGSSAVRPLEMAEAYSVFAAHGNRVIPFGIRRVEGPSGIVLREYRPRIVYNVLSENTVEPMRDILRRVVLNGTGRAASSVTNAAGKTGTTNDHKDAWFCGYTDRVIGIVWVANATYDPKRNPPWHYGTMRGVFGGEVSAPLWASVIKPIQEMLGEKSNGHKPKSYGGGETLETSTNICLDSQMRATKACPRQETRTMKTAEAKALEICPMHGTPGDDPPPIDIPETDPDPPITDPTPPPATDGGTVTVEICVETGARATQYCPVKRMETFPRSAAPTAECRKHRPEETADHPSRRWP